MLAKELLVQSGSTGASVGEDAIGLDHDGVRIVHVCGQAGFRIAQNLQVPFRTLELPLPFPDLLQKLGAVSALKRKLGHEGTVRGFA